MIDVYNLEDFAPAFFKISDKQGQLVPFVFNRSQLFVHAKIENQLKRLGYVRVLILKGRQQGISTYIQARFFHRVLTMPGTNAFILTHMTDATQAIFEMTKRYNNNLPKGLAPTPDKDNENRLLFNRLSSGYRVGTAGSKTIGRSMTNQLLHLSEYAMYDQHVEIKTGIEQTVADLPGTEKIKESTAKGINNAFYMDWMDAKEGKSDWETIFVPWYWDDGYTRGAKDIILSEEEKDWLQLYKTDGLTMNHIAWRRNKLADFDGDYEQKCKQFRQEYPFTDEEAFLNSITDTFITVEPVQQARRNKVFSEAALIIGVDPARGGEDKSAVCRRNGRVVTNIETYKGLNTMQLAGKLKLILDNERPHKMFIDSIGIGAGVVDRLQEMGYENVIGINVSRKSSLPDRFKNLRSELWSEMRDWFNQDMPVQIPDDPELQKEICGLGSHPDSSGRLQIESKDDAKGRGMKSPDCADALMITFAYGQHAGISSYQPNFIPEHTAGRLI
jgi:hypothetical protein